MRRTITALATAIALSLPVTACNDAPRHVAGDAAPVGALPQASATSTPVATKPHVTPASKGTSPPAAGTSRPSTATSRPPAASVLGPTGLGALRIGMTAAQAQATGLIAGYRDGGTSCSSSHLKNHPDAVVVHSPRKGVVSIPAYGQLHTPEGVRVGSTMKQVRAAYDDLRPSEVDDTITAGSGRAWAAATTTVNYRFMFRNNKVTGLWLEIKGQDCYE
ncbi:hypothetical protein [Actinoplanes siamensis]|uniref:Lipoprotein n=1 Tax=Actinoplanes siamensis TaxID=1223317 RepID=A0A919NE25_9ACTN|nr:hypothetical protein [Actinoplanes siamensis]GIF09529.1 hypothetical protein Asi03nite_70670 [Actinoplanes siamensis]